MMQRVMEFIKEVRAELGKITWPTRSELIESTFVVVISVILLSFFIGGIDQVFNFLLRAFAQSV